MLTPEEEAHKARLLQELKDLEENARARWMQQVQSRIYSFANVADPEDLATLQRFQRIFGRYAPWLLESEHATIRVHGAMHDGLIFNPPETINKNSFETDLKRFRKAVETLADWPIWGLKPCMVAVPSPPEIDDPEDVTNVARQIYDCLLTVGDAEHHYGNLSQVLDELEQWARKGAEYVPNRRNIKWKAVHAVDHLRGYWENMTETPAPSRALNPASPFADYLRDAFEFFEIPGDPMSAFKRWVALEEKEPDVWK
ncbi:hypothetical protein MesoLjLc_45420 [Mesorhizobium sp. L-8-10]|uniref:hypothetical protein n=1 Tax=Mesorhizobium sp. L-8-10 TaxID=2744523 RepID=UPI001927C384|nr:hypothetical protein [Mesorhizobium sp. L-8-10]BCH32612.1 hypothetical protein MesoLjLc_45420 [Mesorhizobium sp. L-8-10]